MLRIFHKIRDPPVKTTKLVVPVFERKNNHRGCYTGAFINYIVLTWDQLEEVNKWAEHHGLSDTYEDMY